MSLLNLLYCSRKEDTCNYILLQQQSCHLHLHKLIFLCHGFLLQSVWLSGEQALCNCHVLHKKPQRCKVAFKSWFLLNSIWVFILFIFRSLVYFFPLSFSPLLRFGIWWSKSLCKTYHYSPGFLQNLVYYIKLHTVF